MLLQCLFFFFIRLTYHLLVAQYVVLLRAGVTLHGAYICCVVWCSAKPIFTLLFLFVDISVQIEKYVDYLAENMRRLKWFL